MRFLDTNVFIRFLTGDNPARAAASRGVFESLDRGEVEAFTSEAVIAEVIYVLTSKRHYGLAREEAAERLRPALSVRGLRLTEKAVATAALDIYIDYSFLDFEDALSVAHMSAEDLTEITSYDEGFDKVAGIVRFEPGA